MPAVGDQHRGGPAAIRMPNGPGPVLTNPFEEPERRMSEYTAMQIATLQARLDRKLGPEYISSRPGGGGQKVHYLSADKCINLANEVFGFNGWSSSIQRVDIDFVDENETTGKVNLGLSVIVRVTLKDGSFHEDIGYGHIENCKGKAAAFEKSKKEGTTDALKRALRNFGNVLGNCVYDKDYLSKVTKIKTGPARWDVSDLHRHPDFAPIKREPVPNIKMVEDDDLPLPRPTEPARSSAPSHATAFDGDGEFGSDLFDEADFVVTHTGNPDEIVIEPEQPQQPPTPMNRPFPQRAPPPGRFDSNVVTPSKPERWSDANNPAARQSLPPNARQNPSIPDQRRPMAAPGPPHNMPNGRPNGPPQPMPNANAQPTIKREPAPTFNPDNSNQAPPQTVGFFSARAADQLRDNPNAAPIPGSQFDPHAESPSIRKTAGIDHTKTVAVVRTGNGVSPAPEKGRSQDFVNPATNMQHRVGGAAGQPGGFGSPLSRGPSVSSFKPLTRPNIDPKNATNSGPVTRGASVPPQNINGKRPPLSDVTNANASPGTNPTTAPPPTGPNDPKRPRMADSAHSQPQQQHQQPPRPPQQ
ncbi:DNA repair and recombination protein radC [Penicillium subrubescens]|nr:DNA repair and recombination protein radC [Penicillium subrubescens]KAJ5875622.1 DNA repair and recombination protein radC [Penicillium subrubescens]